MLLWSFGKRLFVRGAPQISPVEAVRLINHRDALVLDVRVAAERGSGHIPQARHLPFNELKQRIAELEQFKNRPMVVSCQWGAQAAVACTALMKNGFSEVFVLRGGVNAWREANLPMEK
jgi:rhodanese-related sulfurtransferase